MKGILVTIAALVLSVGLIDALPANQNDEQPLPTTKELICLKGASAYAADKVFVTHLWQESQVAFDNAITEYPKCDSLPDKTAIRP